MNKYAAEKIAQQYYALGIQYALQNAGLIKTADPILDYVKKDAYGDASKAQGINAHPFREASLEDIARKYDMDKYEIKNKFTRGLDAAERSVDFGRALGENNSAKAFGLPYGTAKVPFRN